MRKMGGFMRRSVGLTVIVFVMLLTVVTGVKAAPKPQYGGVMKIIDISEGAQPIGAPWEVLGIDTKLIKPAVENLIKEDINGGYHPALATGWKIDTAKNTITLSLRKGVKFHDGTDFNANAAKWCLDRSGYREYFEKHALDIVQPDLGLVGGITERKKICDFANVYDIFVQCHVCASPVATACALQLEAAIPNFIIHEHLTWALKRDLRNLVKQHLQPKNGYFDVSDAPGLGIELNDKVIAQYLAEEVK